MPTPLEKRPTTAPAAHVDALVGHGRLGRAVASAASAARLLLDEIVGRGPPDPAWLDELVRGLGEKVDARPDEARALLFIAVVREPRLLARPPGAAIETVVDLYRTLAPVDAASLWWRAPGGRLTYVAGSGEASRTKTFRAAAAGAISGAAPNGGLRRTVRAMAVSTRPAALAYRCAARLADRCSAYASEAAAVLDVLFVLDDLLSRSVDRERSLVESSERRLVRVGFDLHDGPMQDIALLAQDVRLFRAQLGTILDENEHRHIALGRVDDLEARLLELDRGLREVAGSLHSPTVLRLPFAEVLEREVEGFEEQAQVEFDLSTSGDLDEMTSTQKIALLRVVQESLTNVREHAGAQNVSVRVHGGRSRLTAEIRDDGRGFDVEHRITEAARAGRLGLAGMGERIRLLGGRFDVESRRGGPTSIRASIPRWRPLGDAVAERARSL